MSLWLFLLLQVPISKDVKEIYLRIFESIDLNKDGFIEMTDIVYSMMSLSAETSDPDHKAAALLAVFDADKDSKISKYEWLLTLSRFPRPSDEQLDQFAYQFNAYTPA